jgi:Concanavalin A-like lectin/glucanases superfamily
MRLPIFAGTGTSVAPSAGPYNDAVLADSPIAFWPLNETTGTVATDATGHGHDGTYTGTFTLGQTGIGDGDTAVLFNGSSGYVAVSDHAALRPGYGAWSLEAWMKTTASGSQSGVLIGKQQSSGLYEGYLFGVASEGHSFAAGTYLAATMCSNASDDVWGDHETAVVVTDQQWHHVVMSTPGWTALPALYVDGVSRSVTSDVAIGTPDITNTDPLGIGQRPGLGGFFGGLIAKAAIYNTELTSGQVAAHYAAA